MQYRESPTSLSGIPYKPDPLSAGRTANPEQKSAQSVPGQGCPAYRPPSDHQRLESPALGGSSMRVVVIGGGGKFVARRCPGRAPSSRLVVLAPGAPTQTGDGACV